MSGRTIYWKRSVSALAGNNREAKIRFTADTSDFTARIKEANSNMAALRAGLKLNEAEFKNTGNSADFLSNKHKLLRAQLEENRKKQEALNGKLNAAIEIYGENSAEAQSWANKLTRARTEEEQLKTAVSECESAIERQAKEEEDAEKPLTKLTNKIERQRRELSQLSDEYANAVLEKGRDSREARSLEARINSLNHELAENERQLNDVTTATHRSANAAQESGRGGWTTFKGVLANLGSRVVEELTQKLIQAAKAVIQTGMEFTASLSNVQALSGATVGEMAKLEEKAKQLGKSTIYSASQVSDAFGYMALAGWDTQDMLDGVDGILNLAAASSMDLAEASDIVTDYLTAFGLSASDSGKFVDQMTYAMSHSNTSTAQLGEAYKNCAATAASLGFSVEDTTAVLMTMANAGVKGGEAGTGLSTIMTRLATDTKGCASELAQYGIQVYDANGSMNELSEILNGVSSIWSGLTDEQQANLAKIIAGTQQYSKLQTIMNGLSDSAQEAGMSFNDYSEALGECEGTAASMASTMQDNLSGDMKALGSAAEGLGLQLYSLFEGPLRSAAQFTTNALSGITDAITPAKDGVSGFLNEIKESQKAVEESIGNAEGILNAAYEDTASLEAYKNILIDLNSQESLTEYNKYQIKRAVEELSGSVPGLAEAYDEVNGTLKVSNQELFNMFNNAKQLALQNALIAAQTESYKALAEATIAKAKADSALTAAQEDLTEAQRANEETTDYVAGGLGDMYGEVVDCTNEVSRAERAVRDADEAMSEAQAQIDEENVAFEALKEQAGLSANSIDELSASQGAAADSTDGMRDATEGLSGAQSQNVEYTDEMREKIEESYNSMRESIQSSVQQSIGFFEDFSGGAEVTAQQIREHLDSQIEGITKWKQNMERLSGEAGRGMSQEMYDALVQMGPQSANLVQTLVDALDADSGDFRKIAKKWAKAMSLSEDAANLADATQSGKTYTEAFGSGAEKGTKKAVDATKEMEEDVTRYMTFMADRTGTQMNLVYNSIATKMSQASESVRSNVDNMRRAMNVTLQGPNIKTPKFSINGQFNMQTGQVPQINTTWNAKGAIFRKPTIFATRLGYQGVGEAGAEAVAPVNELEGYVYRSTIDAMSGFQIDYDTLADKIARACERTNISVNLSGREVGRILRG